MAADLLHPPASRFNGPIIDAHCHFSTPIATARMIRAGTRYGVHKWIGICHIEDVPVLRKRFGPRAGFNVWLDHKNTDDTEAFVETNLRIIERAARLRCQCIKF